MPGPLVEGASPKQLEILRDILAGLGSTRITGVVVRPHKPDFEEHITPPPGPYGVEIVVATSAPEDLRGAREAQLLALAFARRSKSAGLTKVAWFAFGGGGSTLEQARPAAAPLKRNEIDRLRRDVAAAAGDATLVRFDVLRPEGHAFAIRVRVDEPHALLRSYARPFLTFLAGWREFCDGIYADIRDTAPNPAWRWAGTGMVASAAPVATSNAARSSSASVTRSIGSPLRRAPFLARASVERAPVGEPPRLDSRSAPGLRATRIAGMAQPQVEPNRPNYRHQKRRIRDSNVRG